MFYFYDNLHILSFIYLYLCVTKSFTKENSELRITGTGIKPESICGVAIKLLINVNNTSSTNGYDIELNSNKCCVVENKPLNINCKFLKAYGGYMGVIDPNSEKEYSVVVPIVDFVGKLGSCIVNIDSRLKEADRVMRNSVKVRFGTNKNSKSTKKCSTVDQDGSNNCAPVNCDIAYNGYRPYYNKKLKRCVSAPDCTPRDLTNEEPDLVYDPRINKCANLKDSMTDIDLGIGNPDLILRNVTNVSRQPKEILLIKSPRKFTEPPIGIYTDLHITSKESHSVVHDAMAFISRNTLLLVVLWIVVVQCCLIVLMARCLGMKCKCFRENKKKIENKFFNYRQDATVTTPLIPTSSIDTETTDFHYQSESSNNQENNFRYSYYKSVHNPLTPEATKKCLSDDILTKYLNRRDWKTYNNFKSNLIPEKDILVQHSTQQTDEDPTSHHSKYDYERNKSNKDRYEVKDSKISDNKRNKDEPVSLKFENEKSKLDTVLNKTDKTVVPEKETINNFIEGSSRKLFVSKNTSNTGLEFTQEESEKEINCHSYVNNKKSKQQKYCNNDIAYYRSEIPLGPQMLTNPTEKETQSYIPRDSLDDIISKTGLSTFPISKVPLKNDSKTSSRVSDISNKTSKNNIRNILSSILQKKTKSRSSSDPGGVANDDGMNDSLLADEGFHLQILHMSQVSDDNSSSNIQSDLSNNQKDSRTNL